MRSDLRLRQLRVRLRTKLTVRPSPAVPQSSRPDDVDWAAIDGAVRRWLSRYAPAGLVDDLAQEALLRVLRRPSGTVRNTEALAITAARSVVIDEARRRARSRSVSTDPSVLTATTAAESTTDRGVEIDEPGVEQRLARCAAPLIAALPAPQQAALRLTSQDDLSQREAARELGLSTPGLKSRVQRARRAVRSAIDGCCRVDLDARGRPIELTPRPGTSCRCGCATP